MQFSDSSNKLGLIEDITFLLSGVDTTSYPTADRTRNINERYRHVLANIFEVYGGWVFQDDNLSTTPYADQTLTSGTAVYAIPTGALTINMVQLKNSGGTYDRPLTPISLDQFRLLGAENANSSTGSPRYYMLYEDSIRLLPTPNYTVASTGIRVFFEQGISAFAASDTTKTPGFASIFHRALSIGAAIDYAIAKGKQSQVNSLQKLWDQYIFDIRKFYAKRWRDFQPAKILKYRDLTRGNT